MKYIVKIAERYNENNKMSFEFEDSDDAIAFAMAARNNYSGIPMITVSVILEDEKGGEE